MILALNAAQIERVIEPADSMISRVSQMFSVTPVAFIGNTGRTHSNTWFAQDCQFFHSYDDACIMHRTQMQAENCAHLVFIRRFLDCSVRATMGGMGLDLQTGHIHLSDEEVRIDCIKSPGTAQGMFIPKALLGYQSGTHAPYMNLSTNPARDAALQNELDRIFDSLTRRNALNLSAFDRFIACLKVAIGSDQQDGDVRRRARTALADTIKIHIEERLDSHLLSTSSILKSFGVSRASLYRMFEAVGGVRQYINDRRIYRAALDLGRGPLRRGEITSIGEKWGFSSSASFNRAVKREFGVPPGALVNTPYPHHRLAVNSRPSRKDTAYAKRADQF